MHWIAARVVVVAGPQRLVGIRFRKSVPRWRLWAADISTLAIERASQEGSSVVLSSALSGIGFSTNLG